MVTATISLAMTSTGLTSIDVNLTLGYPGIILKVLDASKSSDLIV